MNMATIKVLLRKNKLNEKGLAPLYLRLIKDRKAKFISLSIYLKPSEWNEEAGKVRKSHPNSARMNAMIAQRIADAEGVAVEMETKSKTISSYKIKEKIIGAAPVDFFPYADKYLLSLEKSGKIGTHNRAKAVIQKLKTYKNNKPLNFDDISVSFLKDYEEYLISKLHNRQNTVQSNFKIIRKLINDGVKEDIITRNDNPFYKFSIKSEKTQREFLSGDELKLIENLVLPVNSMMNHHKNMYVFAAYAGGLRISDILTLKWSNYDGERLILRVQKTMAQLTIKLPNKANEILSLYKSSDSKPEHFIFPILVNDTDYSNPRILHNAITSATTYTNKDLKAITKKVDITKHISFHTSRHTFATLALRKGMRIEYVSKLLGHSNIKETQIYAKIVNEELDKAMDVFNN
jgi:integrase